MTDVDRKGQTVRAGTVPAVLVLALLTAGCAGLAGQRPPVPAPAEVAGSGPDCLADEVLAGVGAGVVPPGGSPRPAPRAGTVPEGFTATRVVECRVTLTVSPAPEAERVPTPASGLDPVPGAEGGLVGAAPGSTLPGEAPVGAASPGAVEPGPSAPVDGSPAGPGGTAAPGAPEAAGVGPTVTEVTLEGDLGPLLAALARRSDPVRPDQPCPAMWESKPQLYLVDDRGRAVRPQWPVTACGFLHEGAAGTLSALRETSSVERVRSAG